MQRESGAFPSPDLLQRELKGEGRWSRRSSDISWRKGHHAICGHAAIYGVLMRWRIHRLRSPNMPSRDESGLIKNEFGRKSSGKQVSAVIIHELLRARGNKNAILPPLHAPPVYTRGESECKKSRRSDSHYDYVAQFFRAHQIVISPRAHPSLHLWPWTCMEC